MIIRTTAGSSDALGRGPVAPAAARRMPEDITHLIGGTPLLPLALPGLSPNVRVLAKAEWLNPGGSVKDRAARAIVLDAEREGHLPAKRLLDASSGNTAIAYAMLGAARGFAVTICLPANASEERKTLLRAFGSEVIETDPLEGSDGAIRVARRLAARAPRRYFYADQYNNPANARAHYETTGPEIWSDTAGSVTHLVAGLGTTGTLMGAGAYLRERNPAVRLIAVEPDAGFHGIEGLKHLPTSIVPGIYDPRLPDRTFRLRTEEAYDWTRRLAREFGLLVGPSAGAAAAAAQRVAADLAAGCVVVIFPDGADRYLSLGLWKEEKMTGQRQLVARRSAGRVSLDAGSLATIRRHCETAYPEEACGGLLGQARGDGVVEVIEAVTLANSLTDERGRRYLIEPDAVLALERRAEAAGLAVVGYFHSHPDAPAVPSRHDREHAWPWYVYLIVSVSGGRPAVARAWRLSDDRREFEAVAINDHLGLRIEAEA